MIKPFVNIENGDEYIVNLVRSKLPSNYRELTHIDPLIGSGSMLFSLVPSAAIVQDPYRAIVCLMKFIHNEPDRFMENMDTFPKNDTVFGQVKYLCKLYKDKLPDVEIGEFLLYLSKLAMKFNLIDIESWMQNVYYGNLNNIPLYDKTDIQDTRNYLYEHVEILDHNADLIKFLNDNNIDLSKTFWYINYINRPSNPRTLHNSIKDSDAKIMIVDKLENSSLYEGFNITEHQNLLIACNY